MDHANSKFRDLALAGIFLCLGAFGFYLFNHPEVYGESTDHLEAEIGHLGSGDQGVRYRLGKSVTWMDVPSHQTKKVRIGDAVFTATHSTAKLSTKEGAQIEIQPNSLVVFEAPATKTGQHLISIQKGTVKLSGNQGKVVLESHGKIYEVEVKKSESIVAEASENEAEPLVIKSGNEVAQMIAPSTVAVAEPATANTATTEAKVAAVPATRAPVAAAQVPRVHRKTGGHPLVATPQPRQPASVERKIAEVSAAPAVESQLTPGQIVLGLKMKYFAINAVDSGSGAPTTLLSKLSPEVTVGWAILWNESLRTTAMFNYQSYEFEPFLNQKTLTNASGSRYHVSFDLDKKLNEHWGFGAGFGFGPELYNHSATITTLTIDQITVPHIDGAVNYDWLDYHGIHLITALLGKYFFGMKNDLYQVKSGYAAGISAALNQSLSRINHSYLEFKAEYLSRKQDTSLITNQENTLTFGLTYGFGAFTSDTEKK